MKRVAIIQARMTSTRLPGKVLKNLAGRPMLAQQLRRVQQCHQLNEICIATTTNATDDGVVELARENEVPFFRGSESDVLSRFVGAARLTQADVVVRLTADCPLTDPATIDRVVLALTDAPEPCDYASNVLKRTFPQGVDAEAMWRDVLERANRMFTSSTAREHVTTGIYAERPDLFLRRSVEDSDENSDLRWTVDTPTDWQVASAFYEALDLGNRFAPLEEMLAFARAHPEISQLNAGEKTWSPLKPSEASNA